MSRANYSLANGSPDLLVRQPVRLEYGSKSLLHDMGARLREMGSELDLLGLPGEYAEQLRSQFAGLAGSVSAPSIQAASTAPLGRGGIGRPEPLFGEMGPSGRPVQLAKAVLRRASIQLAFDIEFGPTNLGHLEAATPASAGAIANSASHAAPVAHSHANASAIGAQPQDLPDSAETWAVTGQNHWFDVNVADQNWQASFTLPDTDWVGGQTSPLPDAVIDPSGVTLVKLASVVEMLKDKFSGDELRRLRASRQLNRYLPLTKLQSEGIPIGLGQESDMLRLDASLMQSASGSIGQAGARSDASVAGGGGGEGGSLTKSLTASVSAGFDSNPFLSPRQNSEAPSLRLQLAPAISREDARSTIRASGRFEHLEYLGRYPSLQNYGADLVGIYKSSERLALNGGLLFRSEILATDLTNPLSGGNSVDPTIPVIPGGNDVTLLGQRQRRVQYGADSGLKYTLSERDEIRWSLTYRGDRFGTNQLSDSNFYSQQLRYVRQVSDGLGIGAVVDASLIKFPSAAFGDAKTVTPQALVTAKLSERLRATGSVGVAITSVELASGKERTTAFAGNASLCYGATRSSLCINGGRQVLPSAIGGARVQTTAGLAYSLRVTERDTLQLGGSYSTASQPLALAGDDFESINAFGRYERKLNERMRLFANAGYIETSGNSRSEASNFQAVVGISVSLGKDR